MPVRFENTVVDVRTRCLQRSGLYHEHISLLFIPSDQVLSLTFILSFHTQQQTYHGCVHLFLFVWSFFCPFAPFTDCNTYNADFDGDEMNCHFPQNDIAAAESKYICATDLQYIVPTDGSPLRGLIQDHVDAGVKMTCKNTFFEKWEYQQLLFAGLASLPGLEVIRMDADIELLPPAIEKPKQLWTGKQVVSTILRHIARGNDRDDDETRENGLPNVSVDRKSKMPATLFGEEQMEHRTIIRDGELLRGILDKAAFGHSEFSMVHAVYEAHGPSKAGLLLNALGRLFTAYLQSYSGHSCRMEDLVLTATTNDKRRQLVQRAYNLGSRAAKAWADSEGGKVQIESVLEKPDANKPLKPVEAASTAAKIGKLLTGKEGKANFAALDGYCMSQLNPLASEIIKACLPNGLEVPFPQNVSFALSNEEWGKSGRPKENDVFLVVLMCIPLVHSISLIRAACCCVCLLL